jgi:superfamily I DNA and/or RNA helicase
VRDARKELEELERYRLRYFQNGELPYVTLFRKIRKTKMYAERKAMREEVRALRKEIKQREKKSVSELLRSCQVILATTTGCDDKLLYPISDTFILFIDRRIHHCLNSSFHMCVCVQQIVDAADATRMTLISS